MGGNTRAIDRSTGEVVKFAGRPAFAEKTDFRRVNRATFKNDFVKLLKTLDKLHKKMFGDPIWDPKTRDEIFSSGEAFNGSSEHLFSGMDDKKFIKHKALVGDIDLTVPAEKIKTIFELLTTLERKQVTDKISYIGQNKPEQQGHQVNALFAYLADERTRDQVFVQVDFEAVTYKDGRPEEFSKFGHSSSWEDVVANIKGVFHKYLLRSVASGASRRDDVVLLTPASPLSPPEKVKVKKVTSPVKLLSFSVDRGLRTNAVQQFLPDGSPLLVNGKLAFKELPTALSEYSRTRVEIYSLIFGEEGTPEDLALLDSFVGLIKLMQRHLNVQQIDDVFLDFVDDKLLGPACQRLDANDAEVDRSAKMSAIAYFMKSFPFLKKHENHIKTLENEYYSSYKTRTLESLVRLFVKELMVS